MLCEKVERFIRNNYSCFFFALKCRASLLLRITLDFLAEHILFLVCGTRTSINWQSAESTTTILGTLTERSRVQFFKARDGGISVLSNRQNGWIESGKSGESDESLWSSRVHAKVSSLIRNEWNQSGRSTTGNQLRRERDGGKAWRVKESSMPRTLQVLWNLLA